MYIPILKCQISAYFDCINKPIDLINYAIKLGLSGIALTDHECLCAHMEANLYMQKIAKEHPNFKLGLGNEIYLCSNRESGQRYYHFILIAKNKKGYRALRELSSRAWLQSFYDRGLERVVTTYDDIKEITNKYPNCLIATTACLGGELSVHTWNLILAEKVKNGEAIEREHQNIVNFILWCKERFGADFYIECAPAKSKQQIAVNKRLESIAKCFGIKMVIGSDAHYLRKEDRFVHKAYLNSKNGEREVDDFYEFTYLQSDDEVRHNLELDYDTLAANSQEIYDKIEMYSLTHAQTIPKVVVKNYDKTLFLWRDEYPVLASLFESDNIYDRYWVNECCLKLAEMGEMKIDSPYVKRLEEEADIKKTVGEKLGTNMFSYPTTLQHYINMFWDCGSTVGAGRGSSCSGLNHYLLGVTQLDPLKWKLPFWRLRL